MPGKTYIFGYGSLVNPEDAAQTLGHTVKLIYPVKLRGWIRDWSVVVDNTATLRKFTLTDTDGIPNYVIALNVRKREGNELPSDPNGVLIEVTEQDLEMLDGRESHYERVDVTKDISTAVDGKVYTYTGLKSYMYAQNYAAASEVILPESYMSLVETSFASLGPEMLKQYRTSTLVTTLPIRPSVLA